MTQSVQNAIQSPGEVSIDQLILVSNNTYISLLDYLVELNIFESIFNNILSGDIVISDSRNLIKSIPIIGDEYLIVNFTTPGFDAKIHKTFKITSVEDRQIIRDQNTQLYTLKFISQEGVIDSLSPMYNAFSGDISALVEKIFTENIQTVRNLVFENGNVSGAVIPGLDKTPVVIFSETENNVKFVSPGWTPFDCINWLSKKSIPKSGKSCNFLFWETNKSFYFGSIEKLFDLQNTIGNYKYAATSVMRGTDDISEKMGLIQSVNIVNSFDYLSNLDNGYFASKFIGVDLIHKKRNNTYYDHVTEFNKYTHIVKSNPKPIFNENTVIRNFDSHVRVYPVHPGIHNYIASNYSEKMNNIYGNRLSNMLDLNSLKLDITIYGRTDIEAGRTISIDFPDVSPAREQDITSSHLDQKYSGNYLITSIHHKINIAKHMITMEVIRDSQPTEINWDYI